MLSPGRGLEVVTDVGEESAVEGVVSSASKQLLLCLDVKFPKKHWQLCSRP